MPQNTLASGRIKNRRCITFLVSRILMDAAMSHDRASDAAHAQEEQLFLKQLQPTVSKTHADAGAKQALHHACKAGFEEAVRQLL